MLQRDHRGRGGGSFSVARSSKDAPAAQYIHYICSSPKRTQSGAASVSVGTLTVSQAQSSLELPRVPPRGAAALLGAPQTLRLQPLLGLSTCILDFLELRVPCDHLEKLHLLRPSVPVLKLASF